MASFYPSSSCWIKLREINRADTVICTSSWVSISTGLTSRCQHLHLWPLEPICPCAVQAQKYMRICTFLEAAFNKRLVKIPQSSLICLPWMLTLDTYILRWFSEFPSGSCSGLQWKMTWNPYPLLACLPISLTSSFPYWCARRLPHK